MDPLAGNQRAYRLADYHARSLSPRAAATGWICRRTAARANRAAVLGYRGRLRSAVFRPETADTDGVRAACFASGAQTWSARVAGAGAIDHRAGRCSVDARRLYENESGQDVCGCGLGDERLNAACALRGDPPDYENCAGREGKRDWPQTSRHCWAGLRDGRLFFAGLA